MKVCTRHILFFTFILFFAHTSGFAQATEGSVLDKETKDPVSYVTVTNKRTGTSVYSDIMGKYKLDIALGDTILFSHPGYVFSLKTIIVASGNIWHYIEKRKYALDEVEILSDMAKFKKDSANKHTIYRTTIKDAAHMPGANFNNGVGVDGIFTSLAFWISGKGKKNKKFVKTLLQDEANRYISIKYNALLVQQQTGLNEDNAIRFMVDNPMPYDYARSATDLEIKMWIRNNYKTWSKKVPVTDSVNIITPQR